MASESIWTRLKEPFRSADIEWRVGRSGVTNGKPWAMVLAYVTNRAIMDRLDEVLGPENWWNHFTASPAGGVLCGITIRLPDGREVTKWDGAGATEVEKEKGALSGAMKRAAVQVGIGRYLYDLPEGFAEITDNGQYRAEAKDARNPQEKVRFRWNPPALPTWALPAPAPRAQQAPPPVASSTTDRHETMLAFIRQHGPAVPAEAMVQDGDKSVPFADYVRGSWEKVKSESRLAEDVVGFIEAHTSARLAAFTKER